MGRKLLELTSLLFVLAPAAAQYLTAGDDAPARLPKTVLYYGKQEAPPRQLPLRAGPLSLIYEDGDLRYIKWGNREIVRRLYVATRDRNWGTVPSRLSDVKTEVRDDSFHITYDVENRQGPIDFFWKGKITGDARGTITFTMEGVARSTFLRNRIGFCVLHPIRECPGARCKVEQADGTMVEGAFPRWIAPQAPFKEIKSFAHEVAPGAWAELRFAGDLFEMEDQRNWVDASYKTFCTPLRLPFPVEIAKGTKVSQAVTLRLQGKEPAGEKGKPDGGLTLEIQPGLAAPVPKIGLGVASHGQPLTKKEQERLKALNLSHLRVDLRLAEADHLNALRRASREADALGVKLEVALFLSDESGKELKSLVESLAAIKPAVAHWLVFPVKEKSTTEPWAKLARRHLGGHDPATKIGGGTNAYFTELNRGRPPVRAIDLVCYSINPQVHAFDNNSLVETLEAHAATVASARQFVGKLPLAVTPVTFKPRFNPDATGVAPEPAPGALPAAVDVRQMSLFGAVWTLGSIKYLAEGGVASVTYYETTGMRGVMETERGSTVPEQFRSLPGSVFPLYHVLADVGDFAGGRVLTCRSSDTLKLDGLALSKDGRQRLLVSNLTAAPQTVTVSHLADTVLLKRLNETNAVGAMRAPEGFRSAPGEPARTKQGKLLLHLLPYEVARIDTPRK